ncbi:acyltransferase [Metabacillus sp. GX 13764]|uniref:acyltransferase family protein n=1 Tax=Metabacillus kandeliae TaxID=2900151 RepID=UPI001E3B3A6B|nr:acyltransferase [Metabacillus kandeliae]MCD7033158.1 acyltransferase [Metabacillus kandeliae]
MEISKNDMKMLKGVAILLMLLLHLFCRKEVNGLYETFPLINNVPLIYYIGLFGDACVPIYCFASGYGLFVSYKKQYKSKNFPRLFKLLINFWIILILFVGIGLLLGKFEAFPGGVNGFILNFFLLSNSYNGAWWFLQTYVILVFISPVLFKLVLKYSTISILLITAAIYLVSYIQRIKHVVDFGDSLLLGTISNSLVLVGTSLFPFILGTIFAKNRVYSKIYSKIYNISYKNILCATGIIALIIIHSVYESMIIAPFTALTFICIFTLMNKSTIVQKTFAFFGEHSTNIWLTHMFFYMSIFPSLTFAPRYPILIFIWLLILCIISSYIINFIYKSIIKMKIKNTPHEPNEGTYQVKLNDL